MVGTPREEPLEAAANIAPNSSEFAPSAKDERRGDPVIERANGRVGDGRPGEPGGKLIVGNPGELDGEFVRGNEFEWGCMN